jgi:hypothetical protein
LADQVQWEINLIKAHSRATGPTSEDGKAASARNIEGHPTPEETRLTRFNAIKHAQRAEVATYFPAKPGKYSACNGCEFLEGCADQVACLKKTELFMRHHIAFETRDPTLLTSMRASLHAKVQAIIDDILLSIIQDGVRIKAPQWYYDKDGGFHLAEYTDDAGERRLIEEINSHPLLKTLGDLIGKVGLTLSDEGMTMCQQDGSHEEKKGDAGVSQDEMREWQARNEKNANALMDMVSRSHGVIDITPSKDADG